MQSVVAFFNHPFFIVVGGIATLVMIAGFLYVAYLILRGVLPVWYRLGVGLSKRKVAIFALTEFESLKSMLVDSKLFKEKNIVQIQENSLQKAETFTLFLVHWRDFQDKIGDILALKKDYAALVIYAPQNEGIIEDPTLEKINSHRNAIIVNFRGRLLNDILISLVTTSYDRS